MPTKDEKEDILVLVTGINGFVGSNLVKYLTSNGLRVRGTVRNPLDRESYSFLFLAWNLNDEE